MIDIFGVAGASAEKTLNNLGSFRRIVTNEKFKDDLKVLLETKKGTLIGDPNFGSDLLDLIFEPANEMTASLIRQEIAITIERYFSNVQVESIDIGFKKNSIITNINYSIYNTNISNTVTLEFIKGGA